MTLYYFKQLSENGQLQVLEQKGVAIAYRKEQGRRMLLYSIDSFYVEVIHTKKRMLVRSFSTDTLLQPYLEQIDLSELLPLLQ